MARLEQFHCPACGHTVFVDLGWLGNVHWVRCRRCGAESPVK